LESGKDRSFRTRTRPGSFREASASGASTGIGPDQQPGTMLARPSPSRAPEGYDISPRVRDDAARSAALLGTGDAALEEVFAALALKHLGRVVWRNSASTIACAPIEAAPTCSSCLAVRALRAHQLYSLRYGTLSAGRAVGGLADSIAEGPQGWGSASSRRRPRVPGGARSALGSGATKALARGPAARDGARPLLGNAPARRYEALLNRPRKSLRGPGEGRL